MPFDFENEARGLAANLDRGRGDEVAHRLQADAQYLGPQGYSALLSRVSQYDQKGVGDDLVIVNQQNGTQEAFIRRAAIDVGTLVPDAPPPQGYYQQNQGYYAQPRPNADCTLIGAGAGAIVGNTFAPNGRRGAGTAIGAIAGALIGNDSCRR